MKTTPTYVQDKFNAQESLQVDLAQALSVHFSHHSEKGESVFNMTRKCARWLLRNCKHTLPTEAGKVADVFRYKSLIESQGMRACWPHKPIRINVRTNVIEGGGSRLLGLAISQAYGTYIPIEIIND